MGILPRNLSLPMMQTRWGAILDALIETVNNNSSVWESTGKLAVTTKTSTYTVLPTDNVILCSGAVFTVTLPTAAGCTGQQYVIEKTDSSLTNIITIATTSSQTIGAGGGTSTTLNTQGESLTVYSDGSNWQVLTRRIPCNLGTEAWVDNQANSTTSVRISRFGNRLFIDGITDFTGAMSGAFTITVPAGYTPDPVVYPLTSNRLYVISTDVMLRDIDGGTFPGTIVMTTAGSINIYQESQNFLSATAPFTWASGDSITFQGSWIVTGWNS